MPKKRIKGRGIVKTFLKGTRILSRGARWIGAPGSAFERLGNHLDQSGYGKQKLLVIRV